MMEITTKKKRGRKPKNFTNINIKTENNLIIENNINSDEEKLIYHLPITITEINSYDNTDADIFIKEEHSLTQEDNSLKNSKVNLQKSKINKIDKKGQIGKDSDESESLKSVHMPLNLNSSVNKITTHSLNFTKNSKCWWCRNSFTTPCLQLPEDYYMETFYCIGNYCSFNCMVSYNLDLNDSLSWKRTSLINLLYYLTYNHHKIITAAPHWMTLLEYGGTLDIDTFRENSIVNTKEYLVLHPPLISRQMQIEESYKLNKLREVPIDKVNKIYSEVDSEFTIKRTKPMLSTHYNLENTMGLIKTKKKK